MPTWLFDLPGWGIDPHVVARGISRSSGVGPEPQGCSTPGWGPLDVDEQTSQSWAHPSFFTTLIFPATIRVLNRLQAPWWVIPTCTAYCLALNGGGSSCIF